MPAEAASAGCVLAEGWTGEERSRETGNEAGGGKEVATCSFAGLALLWGIYGKLEHTRKRGLV